MRFSKPSAQFPQTEIKKRLVKRKKPTIIKLLHITFASVWKKNFNYTDLNQNHFNIQLKSF